jgi:protein-tyrosine phosphatase
LAFVELHFHLLPGIDDGPGSIEESLELAAAAVVDGTRTVVVTPHVHQGWVSQPAEIHARTLLLAERLRHDRLELALVPGGELAHPMVERLSDRELELIAHGPRGARWVLLEAPFEGLDGWFTAAADELRARGFGALIAHPERVRPDDGTRLALSHELSHGSILQLTAGAFTGLYGAPVRCRALELLRCCPRAVIASDAHGRDRMPMLTEAVAALALIGGVRDSSRHADMHPRLLLDRGIVAGPAAAAA